MAVSQKQKTLTNLEQFKAHIRDTELSRTERFECTFKFPATIEKIWRNGGFDVLGNTPPGSRQEAANRVPHDHGDLYTEATIMCEEVQIPGMVLQNKEVAIGTWQFMRNSNVSFLGNEINLTWITDAHWKLRHVFEAWISHCVDTQSKRVRFPDEQYGTIWINLLGMDDKVRTTWELHEVTPKVLNLVPLATGSTSISRTTLIISSAYWTSKTVHVDLEKQEKTGNLGGFQDVAQYETKEEEKERKKKEAEERKANGKVGRTI